jgi:hypothetical protein
MMGQARLGWLHVVLAAVVGLAGCSRKVDRPLPAAEQRLLDIGTAYLNAINRLKRPPRGFDDLKPSLQPGATEDYLRSPGDGEPFVIFWGIDYHKLPPGPVDPFTVAAYEKKGVEGKRYVLRFPRSVVQMTDEELRKAVFPSGHSPP